MTTTGGTAPCTTPGAGAAPGAGAGAGAVGALAEALTVTCLNHQPLPGVCTYTDNVWLPAGSAPAGMKALKPDADQNPLARAAPTSGRLCANDALASIRPPPSMAPRKTWTSSMPAHP